MVKQFTYGMSFYEDFDKIPGTSFQLYGQIPDNTMYYDPNNNNSDYEYVTIGNTGTTNFSPDYNGQNMYKFSETHYGDMGTDNLPANYEASKYHVISALSAGDELSDEASKKWLGNSIVGSSDQYNA